VSALARSRLLAPTLLQAQQLAGTLTVFAAFLAAAASGELGWGLVAVFLSALLLGQLLGPLRAKGWVSAGFLRRYPAAWTALLLVCLALLSMQVLQGQLDVVIASARFALLLCAHRLLNRQTERDELLLLLLSLLLLCVGAALSAELLFGLAFALYAVAGTWALALTHLRWQIEASRAESAPALLQSRRLISPPLFAALAGLSLLALAGAAGLFFVFPRVTLGGLHRLARPQAVAGLTDTIELGGHGTIADDPRIALRARLPQAEPGDVAQLSQHWRARALEVWTGRGWRARPGPVSTDLVHRPDAPHRSGARRVHQTTEIELLAPFNEGVLIVPEGQIASVSFPEPMSARPSTRQALRNVAGDLLVQPVEVGDLGYQVTTLRALRGDDEEPGSSSGAPLPPSVQLDTEAPQGLDPRVRALGEKLVKGKDSRAAAEAVQAYLGQGFRYTRELDDSSPDPIADFLFRRRAGHCELFSSAMVLLLRAGGVPARNVTGFYGGVPTSAGYVAVRAGDAHSWVEVWERGRGWVLWDPTPPAERGSHQEGLWAAAVLRWDGLEARWRASIVEFDLVEQVRALQSAAQALSAVGRSLAGKPGSSSFARLPRRLALLGALVLSALAVRALRARARAGSGRERSLAADQQRARELWRQARAQLSRAGVELPGSLTPREAARRASAQSPSIGPALERLVARCAAARWGRAPLPASEARVLLAVLRRALRA